MRTDTKIIRADTVRAAGWSPPVAGILLELATSGEKRPLTIRVQPDLPAYLTYSDNETRDKLCEAAWERAAGLDQGLLRAVTNAAKLPGGAVVFLDHAYRCEVIHAVFNGRPRPPDGSVNRDARTAPERISPRHDRAGSMGRWLRSLGTQGRPRTGAGRDSDRQPRRHRPRM